MSSHPTTDERSHLAEAIERLRSPNASFGGEYMHAHVLSSSEAAALLLAIDRLRELEEFMQAEVEIADERVFRRG